MIKVPPETCIRWIRDHFPRHSVGTEDELLIRLQECPLCGHRKKAVRFNAKTQRLTCFRCQGHLSFIDLVKMQLGFKRTLEVLQHLKAYGETRLVWERTQDVAEAVKRALYPRAESAIRKGGLDLSSFSTDWTSAIGRAMLAYAVKRDIPEEILHSGLVGYFRTGSLVGRLSFLVTENRLPVFAVGRAIRPEVTPKYLYPRGDEYGGSSQAGYYVHNIDAIEEGDTVPIAEGIISSISADPKCVSTLGNAVTSVQASKLYIRRPGCCVYLREHGITEAHAQENVARLWSKGIPSFIADLIDGDPNDNKEQMPAVMASAREATPVSKILAILRK